MLVHTWEARKLFILFVAKFHYDLVLLDLVKINVHKPMRPDNLVAGVLVELRHQSTKQFSNFSAVLGYN